MKVFKALLLLFIVSGLFAQNGSRIKANKGRDLTFLPGEKLKYRLHLGFVTAGVASLEIANEVHDFQGTPCYKIDIHGRTVGLVDFTYRVKDNWGTYLDTAKVLPLRSYRYIKEGRYRKNEIVDYDHQNDSVIVHKLNKKTKELERKVPLAINNRSQGLVSGYYFLRTLDFESLSVGDTICMDAFFDDDIYNFEIIYLGKDKIKTSLGKFKTRVFAPVMEKNRLFNGKDAVKVWISDDDNKIPLKIRASIFVGALEADLTEAVNVKSPLDKLRLD